VMQDLIDAGRGPANKLRGAMSSCSTSESLQDTFSILKPSGSTYSAPAPFAEALQMLLADLPLDAKLLRSCLHSHASRY